MKTKLFLLFFGLLGFVVQSAAKEKIYVNSEVTTHIVMPENIKLVDISTTKIMGNQCADNMVRIKPYLEKRFCKKQRSVRMNFWAPSPWLESAISLSMMWFIPIIPAWQSPSLR